MSTRMQMHACTLRTLAVFMYIPLKILLRITHLIIAKGFFWGGGGGGEAEHFGGEASPPPGTAHYHAYILLLCHDYCLIEVLL